LFLASSGNSTPMGQDGKPLPSSSQTMWGLAKEIEKATGARFRDVDLGIGLKPYTARRLDGEQGGSIILVELPLVQHQDQPRLVAPVLWRSVLLPWLGVDPCGPASMMGLGDGAAACPVYAPSGMEPWMAASVADPGFMGDEVDEGEPVARRWGLEQCAVFGVGAMAGWAAWNGLSPLFTRARRARR